MILSALSILVGLSAQPHQPYDADLVEGRQVAEEIVYAYAEHPAGPEVMDYFACYSLYTDANNVLFSRSAPGMVVRSTEQIWDISRSPFTYRHDRRSGRFWAIVRAHVRGAVLTRFAEVGVEGCRDLLARYEMPREAYFAMQEEERRG